MKNLTHGERVNGTLPNGQQHGGTVQTGVHPDGTEGGTVIIWDVGTHGNVPVLNKPTKKRKKAA